MMGWAKLSPKWALVGVAVATAFTIAWWIQGMRWTASEALLLQEWAQQQRDWANETTKAVDAARAEEQRRVAAVEAVKNEAIKSAGAARADADRLRADLVGLRRQLDTIRRDATGRDPTLAEGSPAGTSPAGVLAYMLGRSIDRAELLASFADRARIAGLTCEASYDSLRRTVQ